MSLGTKVLTTTVIGGVPHVISEINIEPASPLAGKRVDQVELGYGTRVLARTPSGAAVQSNPTGATTLAGDDVVVVHTAASQLSTLAAAAKRA
jgi:Trk K+ transport system NAD-binding subunit